MRPSRLFFMLVVISAGLAFGLALPRWRIITIVFDAGGRTYHLENQPSKALPGTMQIDDDGRLRLRVINADSVGHSAGVLGLPGRDSAIVSADLCTGTHKRSTSIIVIR